MTKFLEYILAVIDYAITSLALVFIVAIEYIIELFKKK